MPHDASRLATALADTTRALNSAIDRWRSTGNPSRGAPPREVTLLALYQQRIYRVLSRKPRLARAVVARLPTTVARAARDTVAARRYLTRLAHGTPPRRARIRVVPPRPAGLLLRYYRNAERRFGVAWEVLAAVNFVESAFGRVKSASVSGAQGPMQFMPATWRAYGMGGNVHDPQDAILGAANYLHASGAPRDYRRALYAYNHSTLYVNAVLRYAQRMARDRRAYYAYYSWQVFVRTRTGERRLTGPR